MNIPIWIKSAYVTNIGNALLSFVWRVSPSEKEGKPPGFGFPCRNYSTSAINQQHTFYNSYFLVLTATYTIDANSSAKRVNTTPHTKGLIYISHPPSYKVTNTFSLVDICKSLAFSIMKSNNGFPSATIVI